MRSIFVLGLSLVGLVGCATYRDDLARGQHYYDLNQYDEALSVCRMLEQDWDSLDPPQQSRYAYLRGMTDMRMGYRADARHWLALAKAISEKNAGGLDAPAIAQLEKTLTELNQAQYQYGPPTSPVATGLELTNVAATPAPLPVASAVAIAPTAPESSTAVDVEKPDAPKSSADENAAPREPSTTK